jgi:hypothetical protein
MHITVEEIFVQNARSVGVSNPHEHDVKVRVLPDKPMSCKDKEVRTFAALDSSSAEYYRAVVRKL